MVKYWLTTLISSFKEVIQGLGVHKPCTFQKATTFLKILPFFPLHSNLHSRIVIKSRVSEIKKNLHDEFICCLGESQSSKPPVLSLSTKQAGFVWALGMSRPGFVGWIQEVYWEKMLRKSECSRHKCNRRKGGPAGRMFFLVGAPIILTEDQGSVPCPHVRQLTTVQLQLQGIHTL